MWPFCGSMSFGGEMCIYKISTSIYECIGRSQSLEFFFVGGCPPKTQTMLYFMMKQRSILNKSVNFFPNDVLEHESPTICDYYPLQDLLLFVEWRTGPFFQGKNALHYHLAASHLQNIFYGLAATSASAVSVRHGAMRRPGGVAMEGTLWCPARSW